MQQPNNHTNNPARQQILQKFIPEYRQDLQLLYLYHHVRNWRNILVSRDWSMLKSLKLGACKIDDSGAEIVGKMNWPNLEKLQCASNKITSVGIQNLFRQAFEKLRILKLSNNQIGDQGMQFLTTTQAIPQIQILSIAGNQITGMGLSLITCAKFIQLRQLDVSQTDTVEAIGFMSLMATSWSQKLFIRYQIYSEESQNMKENIDRIADRRFQQY